MGVCSIFLHFVFVTYFPVFPTEIFHTLLFLPCGAWAPAQCVSSWHTRCSLPWLLAQAHFPKEMFGFAIFNSDLTEGVRVWQDIFRKTSLERRIKTRRWHENRSEAEEKHNKLGKNWESGERWESGEKMVIGSKNLYFKNLSIICEFFNY